MPTTAGTGSEVSAASVVTDTDNQIKVGILSNWLRPTAAVVDPLMTLTCPPKVTADSGIDALTHAIEAYTAIDNADFPLPAGERTVYQGKHPMGDLCAEQAITLVGKFLRRAVQDGSDLEAREGMALAAMLAGMAFSNVGVALVHAMEYPVGGAVHCSHGAGNGLLLPYVMRFNLPAKTNAFAQIAPSARRKYRRPQRTRRRREGRRRRRKAARRHRHPRPPARHRHQAGATARPRRKDRSASSASCASIHAP